MIPIRRLIDLGTSGISICQEIDWEKDRELDWEIVLEKGLVSVASPSGFDWGIVTIKLDKTVESNSLSYKRAY